MMTIIHANLKQPVNTGSIQFNDDWPGVFMTPEYIHEMIKPQKKEEFSITDASKLASYYINGFYNNMVESIADLELFEVNLTFQTDIQLIENAVITDDAEVPIGRVETGLVSINGQIGYFLRGDNASYLAYLLSAKKELTSSEIIMKTILSSCRI